LTVISGRQKQPQHRRERGNESSKEEANRKEEEVHE
jgi:hypothetical protein